MDHLYVTTQQYDDLIERLILKVDDEGYRFDSILCLARGGMRVGDIFSRVHDMPLAVMVTSSYREDAGKTQGELDIARYISQTRETMTGRLLIVDDMVDSGKTICEVVDLLKKTYPSITEIKVAVLWYKAQSVFKPDFYVEYLEKNPWIHQPFEIYDGFTIEKLREKRAEVDTIA